MKKFRVTAALLLCIIMSTSMLTSCGSVIEDIVGGLGIRPSKNNLSTLGIGYSYNLIENEAYDVTKTSTSSVLDVGKLLKLGTYDNAIDINTTRFKSYHYSSVDELVIKQMFDLGFEVGFDFVIGEMKVAISGDGEYDKSEYTYNETFVVQDEKVSKQHIIRDINDMKKLNQCLTEDFVNDIKAVKEGKMRIGDIYEKYGTHAIVGVVTGGAYTAQYVVSTNDEKIASKANQNYQVLGKADIGKFVEFGSSLDIALSEDGRYGSTDTKTDFSIVYSGSKSGTTTTLDNLETAIKDFEAGVEEHAVPINFPEDGAIPLADLIRAVGYEYSNIADDFQNYVGIEAYKAYIGFYNLPLEYEQTNGKNYLIMDFSAYQKNGSLEDLHDSSFKNGIITISPMMAYNADAIIIKGGLGYSGTSNLMDGFSIKLDERWNKDIDIIVENIGAKTVNGGDFIDTSDVNNKYRINIEYLEKDIIHQNSVLWYHNDELPSSIKIVLEEGTQVNSFDMTKQDFPTFVNKYGDEFFKFEGLFAENGDKISDENGKALIDISSIHVNTIYPKFTKTRTEHYIATAEDLKNMSNNVSGNYIIIVDELDLTTLRRYMFADFHGTLDGNGCILKNWSYTQDSVGEVGLFRNNYGTIKNITIQNFSINTSSPNVSGELTVGIMCGRNYGTIECVIIKDSSITSSIGSSSVSLKNQDSTNRTGIICGWTSGSIKKCEVNGCNIKAYSSTRVGNAIVYVGGITGVNYSGGVIKDATCKNSKIYGSAIIYYHWLEVLGNLRDKFGVMIGTIGGVSDGGILEGYKVENVTIDEYEELEHV